MVSSIFPFVMMHQYGERNDDIVQKKVIAGMHPYVDSRYKERSFIERKLIELMEQCWIYNPDERISIFDAVEFLRKTVKEHKEAADENLL
jgi:hypothetical protein